MKQTIIYLILVMFAAVVSLPAQTENTSDTNSADTQLSKTAANSVPELVNYQGILTNSDGTPFGNGTISMVFKIFDAEQDGNEIWSETHSSVTVTGSVYHVLMGGNPDNTPGQDALSASVFSGPDRWLEVTVDGETLTPRSRIASVPYALQCAGGSGSGSGDGHSLDADDGSPEDALYVDSSGDVGIGIQTPKVPLHVAEETPSQILMGMPHHAQLLLTGTENPNHQLRMGFNTNANRGYISVMDGSMLMDGSRTYYPLILNDNVTVSESGYLGIGTKEPTGHLHLKAANPLIRFEVEDEEDWTLGDYGKYEGFKIRNSSDAMFMIKDGGYVGIGTESPAADLHIKSSGNADLRLESGSANEWNVAGGSNFFIAEVDNSDNYHDYITINQDSPIRVRNYDGSTCLRADANEGVVIGSGTAIPPAEGLYVKGVIKLQGGSDIAEPFEMDQADHAEPGMVVVIDREHPGKLKISETAYDRCVAGIISGAGGVNPGLTLTQDGMFEGSHHVALTGRVFAMCDAENTPIEPGDLLTTSDTPGHAMKATNSKKAQGAVIGKAMSGLDSGQGLVLVLVALQ